MSKLTLSPSAPKKKGAVPGMREWALMYAGFGWKVFPVHEIDESGNCSCAEGEACGRPGKHPRVGGGVNEASGEKVTIEGWWSRWPKASIGIATGRASSLTVIDADAGDGKPGLVNLSALSSPHGGLPSTLSVNTGGGGLHLFFAYSADLRTGSNVLGEAIDVRNDGGYVVAPPSGHYSGRRYEWRANEGELLGAPKWAIDAAGSPKKKDRKEKKVPKKTSIRIERVEEMLKHIDPDDREKWLSIGVILGRVFSGTEYEIEAWGYYEGWAARSPKFDEDRAGCLARMREMFYEVGSAPPRSGGKELGVGSVAHWAREGGWNPWGSKVAIPFEPGNEMGMAEELVRGVLAAEGENRFFQVMGEVRDVVHATIPSVRLLSAANSSGESAPKTLIVRRTTTAGMLAGMMRAGVIKTIGREGEPVALQIPPMLANLALADLAGMFPPLAGVVGWPLVGEDGEIIIEPRGYSKRTGLYFEIAEEIVSGVDGGLGPEEGWARIREELLVDFPFDGKESEAAALGLFLAFMERPLMKTCPAFAVVAPQAGTGKSTLIEIASLAVHGGPIASHAWSLESEELRKAIHSLLIAKIPAVNFDNVARGSAVDSDHLAKLLTTEMATDRTLGASETRKELNTLLVTFTGNNIGFARDLGSRVLTIRMNARTSDPLRRSFHSKDIRRKALAERRRWVEAVVAVARGGVGVELPGNIGSRFEDFDLFVARAVYRVTGVDIRGMLSAENETDADADAEQRDMMLALWFWQERGRGKAGNGKLWRTGEVIAAIESKALAEEDAKAIIRGIGNTKAFESDPTRALSYALRALNGVHKWSPLVLGSELDRASKTNVWGVRGGPTGEEGDRDF